ncbi:hypothetical protein EZS27_014045 [termite gut metagenome]|uniref:DUF5119 domain-containing protein n=1 Tax=termite gut metagenome TaxID=433724 RepID=A0A5J4RV93_9ZZZZ
MKEEGLMAINKWLLFLLYVIGVCAACTKEDVVHREEGKITIVPVWDAYTGSFHPTGIKYYFYNINDHSDFPVVVEEPTGKGVITQVLPVGTYRLVGYNTNVAANLIFDTTNHLTVVAKFLPYPYHDYIPLNLCIISSENILIRNKDVITKEIIPVEVKTKLLELVFKPQRNITVDKIKGTLDGAFSSIDLANGKALKDEGDLFFDVVNPDKRIKFWVSDPLYEESVLSLTLEVGEEGSDDTVVKTGRANLHNAIKAIQNTKPDDPITLNIDIENLSSEKVSLTVGW